MDESGWSSNAINDQKDYPASTADRPASFQPFAKTPSARGSSRQPADHRSTRMGHPPLKYRRRRR